MLRLGIEPAMHQSNCTHFAIGLHVNIGLSGVKLVIYNVLFQKNRLNMVRPWL